MMTAQGHNFRKDTSKCVFKSCPNTAGFPAKPGLYFFMFSSVPPPFRDEWIRIVARERGEPSFKPHANSMMCSEHFTPNERSKLCKNKIRELIKGTLLPTINIGPYDDTVIIKDDDVRDCSQRKDVVCIIENQIRTEEPEPHFTDEKEVDIEDQIQFNLVGKTNPFEGLFQNCDPKTTNTPIINEQKSDDNDVIIVEDVREIEYSVSKYGDQFTQFIKKRDENLKNYLKRKRNSNSNQFTETKSQDPLSHFTLQQLLTRNPPLPTEPLPSTMSRARRHVVTPHNSPTPQNVTKAFAGIKAEIKEEIKGENDVDDDVVIVAEDIEFDVSEDEIEQENNGKYKQFLEKSNAGTVTKKKRWNSVEPKRPVSYKSKIEINNQFATTQHTKPTNLVTLQNFTTAPLLMASPMLTTQNGTVQSEGEIEQEYNGKYKQFLEKLNAGTVTKKKRWNSVEPKRPVSDKSKIEINNQFATTQHTKPTNLVTLQNFTTAPLFMSSPMLTTQYGTVQQLIPTMPMIATNAGQQVHHTTPPQLQVHHTTPPQLIALIPASNDTQHNTLYLQNNNLQTYFLSPGPSTPQLVIDSGQMVIKKEEN